MRSWEAHFPWCRAAAARLGLAIVSFNLKVYSVQTFNLGRKIVTAIVLLGIPNEHLQDVKGALGVELREWKAPRAS